MKKLPKNKVFMLIFLIIMIIGGIFFIPSIPSVYLWGKDLKKPRKGTRNYEFNGTMSREVLESYLSRSITYTRLLDKKFLEGWAQGDLNDSIRFISNIGAKFIGRVIFRWGSEKQLPSIINDAKKIAERIHNIDPEIILQACNFEIVTQEVNFIPIPGWIFEEFNLMSVERNFSYADMYEVGGNHEDYWGKDTAVPDMSKLETKMWFLYLAATYIDIGIEAIHFGQVELMSKNDPDHTHWRDMLSRVRSYAQDNARRHMVICDAHTPTGGYVNDGKLMFDFHSFPQRPEEIVDYPQKAQLTVDHLDAIYKKSKGGITPSGWACKSLPYLVEFDNFGISDTPGENTGDHMIWGYDEITWYAHQSEEYRNDYLRYVVNWLEENDPNGFLQMPGSRPLAETINGATFYFANSQSENMTYGFNQEKAIKNIWENMPQF